jgi:excisionase family DNA binding protein
MVGAHGATMADCIDVTDPLPRRFLKLDDVAEILSTSSAQVYALVRRGELRAIKLGGRGQWRCSVEDVDAFVERLYAQTTSWIEAHPFTGDGTPEHTDPETDESEQEDLRS